MSDSYFRGKTAIVTGGASGIGRALSQALVRSGAYVVVADIREDAAKQVATELGSDAEGAQLDVTDAAAVQALVDRVHEDRGLDLMFNNAGIAIVGDAAELSVADWDKLVDVNIRGVMYGTAAAYRAMRQRGRGHIVNTASVAGLIPAPTFVAYAATKHAVVGLSTSLRVEAAPHGVAVSAVCPGVIETPMVDGAERRGFGEKLNRGNLGFKPYDAADCARDILAGVARNDGVIVVTRSAKFIHRLYRHVPAAARRLIGAGYRRTRERSG